LAVVEHAEADFESGLTVLTGETGAGKSVFMGALMLALGARADASSVRDGCKEARIEVEFFIDGNDITSTNIRALLENQGLPPCEDGRLLVRRAISGTGGSRVWINDASTTVQTLKTLGDMLVDIHGPNDHQSLLKEEFQRELLDRCGGVDRKSYDSAWLEYSTLRERLEALRGTGNPEEEIERLRYSVDELEAAELTEDDETELPRRHAAAAHSAEIVEAAADATRLLGGDDGGDAAEQLIAASQRIREISRYHESAGAWNEELERIITDVQELSRTIADSVSRIDADPATLQALDDRLTLVLRLKRKYSCADVPALMELLEKRRNRLADLEGKDEKLRELETAAETALAKVRQAGAKLSAARKKAGTKLSAAITKELRGLGFLQAGFSTAITEREPDANGCDYISFLFEPNPGEHARALSAIASTGEIARVMLAVKTVTAAHDSIPVLVFDEIDSNIGGETGRAVGIRLKTVARKRQVVAITHLPQSAAYGDRHFVVEKSVSGGRTRSAIREVSGEERIREITRMLGGENASSVAAQHARELLDGAKT
jgi:DNA repair protein RecN (Recombination protein N)